MVKITPMQFIETIFFDVPPDECPLVAHPIHTGKFTGRFRQLRPTHKSFKSFSDGTSEPIDWYFGISTVALISTTTLKRRKQDMKAVYVVVLDDIGTKCEVPPVAPSYILETSEGNYQYGYLLTTPVDNMQWFELFMSEIGKRGFADVGTLDSTRIMRVPMSKNIKEGRNGWLSRITQWNPEISYDLDDLATQFGIKLPPERKVARVSYISSAYSDIDLPEIVDPVFDWLQENNRVRGKQGNGYYEIQCPFHKAHSDGRDEAGYKPLGLGAEPEFRLYKCHHSHPQGTTEFLEWVHEQSGLDVGSCDRVAIDVALAKVAKLLKIEGVECAEASSSNDIPDILAHDFGTPLPIDSFPHRVLIGSGKNSKVCPSVTVDNLVAVFNAHNIRCVRDAISRKQSTSIAGSKATIDYAYGQVRSQCVLSDFTGFSGFRDIYNAAITQVTDLVNPVTDYLDSLKWDKHSRLRAFLDTIDCQETEIRDLAVTAWLAQCVAMARGDNAGGGSVLVLAGRGGIGKTALLQSLVPVHLREYMKTGMIVNPTNKDDIAKVCSAWITELGELDGTFRRSDMAALKAFLTDEYDSYRPPYGHEVVEFKRHTSFSATVNDSLFLADLTGGGYRRFWVVECDVINWQHGIDIDQLWAEVVYRMDAGEISRRLTASQAETVEQAARDAALYNDDLVIEDLKRLWPSLRIEAYRDVGQMDVRLSERDIIAMLPSAGLAGASESELRKMISRVRAYLKDSTPKGKVLVGKAQKASALSSHGGKHLWLLPKPVMSVVGGRARGT